MTLNSSIQWKVSNKLQQSQEHWAGIHIGEIALRSAVLTRAMVDLWSVAWDVSKRNRLEAEEWILADDYESPYSFINVCTALGFEVEDMRKYIFSPEGKKYAVTELYKKGAKKFKGRIYEGSD